MPQHKDQKDDPVLIELYNAGLKHKEIAVRLGRTEQAVRVRLNVLRKRGRVGYRGNARLMATRFKYTLVEFRDERRIARLVALATQEDSDGARQVA